MPDANVYAPPQTSPAAATTDTREVALYSPIAVMICGAIFGPIVGCGMAATNYSRLGEAKKAQGLWVTGIVCFVVVAAVVVVFRDAPTIVRGASIGGTVGLASSLRVDQKRIVDAHVQAGGRIDAPIVPVFASLLVLLLVLAAISLFT